MTAAQDCVEERQAAPRLPSQNPGDTQAPEDVGLSIQISGLAREPVRILQLLDRFIDIAEVSEDHTGRLVRDRCLRRRRVLGQHLTSGRECLRWP